MNISQLLQLLYNNLFTHTFTTVAFSAYTQTKATVCVTALQSIAVVCDNKDNIFTHVISHICRSSSPACLQLVPLSD